MLLLDTCVISETVNRIPDAHVITWMRTQNPAELFISAVTLGELHYGVARLATGGRQRNLALWIADVEQRFADRIVVLDDTVARQWGHLRARHPNVPVADAQIAATALAFDFVLVTRNVRHFQFDDLELVNPWET
ncbi:MAG TPA: type II toxin-antitoxin system VapC family toxin [Rhizomicrobium sp.]|jgi:predicted nucleic acid-binding protein|nr:type II toxin-antitoxin system VapC family toxin [Rhizomicrobium sp.]